jgi:hypothetical protein
MLAIAIMTGAIMRLLVGSSYPAGEADLEFRLKFSGKQHHNRVR